MYNKKTWESNEIITKEALNNIENGIYDVTDRVNNLEKQAVYFIDLEKWGITNGFIEDRGYVLAEDGVSYLPKYTDEEYEIAHNNKEGLNAALQYAVDNGYNTAVLPNSSEIFICWEEPNESCNAYYLYNKRHIILPSNLVFDMNHSTIKVIFDSKNANPYDKSQHSFSNPIYYLNGYLITIASAYNSTIKNGTLLGTLYDRAFIKDTVNETNSEQNYDFGTGIYICKGSSFINIENMVIKGFMADGIASMTDNDPAKGNVIYMPPFNYIGDVNADGTLSTVPTSYTTEFLDISDWSCKEGIMRTNIGYTRVPDIHLETYYLSFYDKDKNIICRSTSRYLQNFLIPNNAKFIRVSLKREASGLELGFKKEFQITPKAGEFCHIRFCEISENHRGGIANMINNSIIEKCKIFNNGRGVFEDVPQFGDTTRYAINCEDCLPLNMIVRDNYIYEHFNGILFAGGNIICQNNIFNNTNAMSIYNCESAQFIGNTLISSSVGGTTGSSVYDRTYIIKDNRFINSNCTIGQQDPNVHYHVQGNFFTGVCGFQNFTTGNYLSARDVVMDYYRIDETTYGTGSMDARNTDNVLLNLYDVPISSSRFVIKTNKNTRNLYVVNKCDYGTQKISCNSYYNSTLIDTHTLSSGFVDIKDENGAVIRREFGEYIVENSNIVNSCFKDNAYATVDVSFTFRFKDSKFEFNNNDIAISISNINNLIKPDCYGGNGVKIYDFIADNCTFDISRDGFKGLIGSYSDCITSGEIIFNNCTFINSLETDIPVFEYICLEGSDIVMRFNKCTFNGNFICTKTTNNFITIYKDDAVIECGTRL